MRKNEKKLSVKKVAMTAAVAAFVVSMDMVSFAGQWVQNNQGWWFDNGNGTWPASSWQWIDGNGDGIAECYYFDQSGYCLMNTTAPGGYQVNASGAWVVNGQVQTKYTGIANQVTNTEPKETLMLYDQKPVISQKFEKSESGVTNKEHESWPKVYVSRPLLSGMAYVEFYAGGEYQSFKAKVAPCDYPMSTWEKGEFVNFQVLGDEDDVLFEKEIDYKTGAFDIDVDITGQDTVAVYVLEGNIDVASVMLKEARFE